MYQAFFGLKENPFSITPDTRFTYLSPQHEEALAHLVYGAYQHGSGGFSLLTGEIGCGKTTLCRLLLERLESDTQSIWILNPLLEPEDFLKACLEELGQKPGDDSHYALYQQLNRHLLQLHANNQRCLLLIDEAQLLRSETLELLRLLTNLETGQQKLMQILLVGQPELLTRLQQPDAAPLNQRITSRFHLKALDRQHAQAYLQHRLLQAGAQRALFVPAALRCIARAAQGVPRKMNIMADRALLAAYAAQSPVVTRKHAQQAVRECNADGREEQKSKWIQRWLPVLAILLALFTTLPWFWQYAQSRTLPPPITLSQAVVKMGGPHHANQCIYMLREDFHCLPYLRAPAELPAKVYPVLLPRVSASQEVEGWLIYGFDPLQFAPDQHALPGQRAALMNQWRGDLLLLWKDPWHLPALIRPGERHLALMALRSNWKLLPGDQLDEALQARIRVFQAQQGIPADGILGPLTQFFLYRNQLLEP